MLLKEKIAARLKLKATGLNLSQKRIDAIVLRAEKGLTDESDDTVIDANLEIINELTPFKEIASLDDHQRTKEAKIAADKEAARLKAIEEGKPAPVEIDPNETKTEKMLRLLMEKIEKQDQAIAAMSGEKITNTRREQYAKVLEGKSPEYIASELKKFDKMSFKDDEDFTATLTDFTQEITNAGLGGDKALGGQGAKPTGTIKVATTEVVDELMNNLN